MLFRFGVWWGKGGRRASWKIIEWGKELFVELFPWLYRLSSYKNHLVTDVLVWPEISCSFLFWFHCTLSYRETMDVVALLSSMRGTLFVVGGEM